MYHQYVRRAACLHYRHEIPHGIITNTLDQWQRPHTIAVKQQRIAIGRRLRDGFSREFVLTNRVLLLVDGFGVAVDLSLGAIPFEERSIARSSLWRSPEGHDLRTCSAEDLLVHKSFAARPHDWLDVEDVLDRQQERLDLDLVRRELKPLAELKPETDIMPELERRISRSQRPVRRFE